MKLQENYSKFAFLWEPDPRPKPDRDGGGKKFPLIIKWGWR
jgi:hypothetical protein